MFTVRSWTFRTSSTSRNRSWVSGRREVMPCWAKAMAVASTAPIQIGRYRSPCASFSKTIGLFDGISTLTPMTSICRTTAPFSRAAGLPLPLPRYHPLSPGSRAQAGRIILFRFRPGCGGWLITTQPQGGRSQPGLGERGFHQRGVQPEGQVSDLPGCPRRRVPGARPALAQLRGDYLLHQRRLAVRGRLDCPQVPGLDAILTQRGNRPGHRERLSAVLPAAQPADQAVILEFGQLSLGDAGLVQQLLPGQAPLGLGWRVAIVRQPLLDDAQRQVGIALQGEDAAQPLDVSGAELAVAGPGALGLDQPFCFEEADLGCADIRKFRAQLGQYLADTQLPTGSGRLTHT